MVGKIFLRKPISKLARDALVSKQYSTKPVAKKAASNKQERPSIPPEIARTVYSSKTSLFLKIKALSEVTVCHEKKRRKLSIEEIAGLLGKHPNDIKEIFERVKK